jgi:uncharacterized phage protein gp47/JayE
LSDIVAEPILTDGYGITATGFRRMRLPEIRERIIETLQAKTGLVFETRPDSVTGEFIDTFAEREATLWELAESVYHAMYPISAFGTNLDHAVSFSGVTRLFARKSAALAILYGVEGTTIPPGAIVKETLTRASLLLNEQVIISQDTAADVTIIIENVADGMVFAVDIDSKRYSVTAIPGDDDFTITAKLAQQLISAPVTVTTDANTIRMFVIESVPFVFFPASNVRITELGSPGTFVAEEFGPLDLPIGVVTIIVTTATGWERVNNIVSGYVGRYTETDDELRRRYNMGVFQLGAATLNAIYANILQNVPGILALKVYENEQDFVDAEGRLPHCIEVVAWGGDAQLLANEIWLQKAAGIDTFGTTTVTVTDSQGYPHPINFNRPVQVFMWLDVQVKLYNKEIFPSTGDMQIKEIITDEGNRLGINEDVIIQRLMCPVLEQIQGIETLTITLCGYTDPAYTPVPTDYKPDTFLIGARQLSRFDESRIAVLVIP